MNTIYFHIGSPKTATSTIQAYFSEHSKDFLKSGLLYPQKCTNGNAHHSLVCDLLSKYSEAKMPSFWYEGLDAHVSFKLLKEEVLEKRGEFSKILLSSELPFAMTGRVRQVFSKLKEEISGVEFKIIIYLRRQDQLYSSFYNQDVKGMRRWKGSPEEFYLTHQMFDRNYLEMVDLWADVFGRDNIIIRPFDAQNLKDNDVVSDMCNILGVPYKSRVQTSENDALGVNQLYIKRCFNRLGLDGADNERSISMIQELLPERPAKNVWYSSKKIYNVFREEWIAVNKCIEERYFVEGGFFSKEIPGVVDLELAAIDRAKISNFLLRSNGVVHKKSALSDLLKRVRQYISLEQGEL